MVVWLVWGTLIGAIVFWFDRDPWAGVCWLLLAGGIASFSVKLLGRFVSPALEWVNQFAHDPKFEERMSELAVSGESESEEFRRLSDVSVSRMLMVCTSTVGFFHGVIFGSVGGALSKLDPTVTISASLAVIYGVGIGVAVTPFIASTIFLFVMRVDETKPLASRVGERCLMFVSPLLIFPMVWHCIKSLVKPDAAANDF